MSSSALGKGREREALPWEEIVRVVVGVKEGVGGWIGVKIVEV